MSDQPSALRQALSRISPAKSVVLILPFTPGILLDPSQLLATIYHTTTTLPTESLLVYFTTPSNPTSKTSEQLYDVLLRNPRGHWDVFQAFLSQVYATLTAAQWASGKVNLKVDVGFAGQHSDQTHRIMNRDSLVLYLEGYTPTDILSGLSPNQPLSAPPLPSIPTHAAVSWTPADPSPGPEVVALGGTFDHLHAAHKLLLQLAHFLATRKVIVGVMSMDQLSKKSYAAYIESTENRKRAVKEFMLSLKSNEDDEPILDIVEIFDPFGPTQDDGDIQALVVSDETRSGGEAVNAKRKENGLGELEVWCIDVISGKSHHGDRDAVGISNGEETGAKHAILKGMDEKMLKEVKMGSTDIRRRLAEKEGK